MSPIQTRCFAGHFVKVNDQPTYVESLIINPNGFTAIGPCLIGGGSECDTRHLFNNLLDEWRKGNGKFVELSLIINEKETILNVVGDKTNQILVTPILETDIPPFSYEQPTRSASFYDFRVEGAWLVKELQLELKRSAKKIIARVKTKGLKLTDKSIDTGYINSDEFALDIYSGDQGWEPFVKNKDQFEISKLIIKSDTTFNGNVSDRRTKYAFTMTPLLP